MAMHSSRFHPIHCATSPQKSSSNGTGTLPLDDLHEIRGGDHSQRMEDIYRICKKETGISLMEVSQPLSLDEWDW